MKRLFILMMLLICACSNDERKKDNSATEKALEIATEVSTNTTDTLCFLHTAGTRQQDTTLVRLIIHNNEVTGEMQNMPYEKDQRSGTIHGKKEGHTINAMWTYMQEGMKDSIKVSFRLEKDQLLQKASAFDPQKGREILPDSSTYQIRFDKVDCNAAW